MTYKAPKKFGEIADIIRAAYAGVSRTLRPRCPTFTSETVASLTSDGLGDSMMLTDLPRAARNHSKSISVWTANKYFYDVMQFNPFMKVERFMGVACPYMVDLLRLRCIYDLGNGHQLQQFRRAYNLPVELKPMGCLYVPDVEKKKKRVILHFDPSTRNSSWQRRYVHPRMRELYLESHAILEAFIAQHKELEFIEVGQNPRHLKGSTWMRTESVGDLIKVIQSGSWFVGIMSGPLHIATALGLRCIVVSNYPHARQIVLPTLKYTGIPEEEWHYPQNVHLHQESSSPLVPLLSINSLEAAFDGEVYPFWRDDWLGLINEV